VHGIVGLHDGAVCIGGHRKFAAAFADREFAQGFDVVAGDADDGGAQRPILVDGLGEIAGLDGAALGEGRRIEVQHHRPLAQRLRQFEGEGVAALRSLRAEIGRGRAHRQGGVRGGRRDGQEGGQQQCGA